MDNYNDTLLNKITKHHQGPSALLFLRRFLMCDVVRFSAFIYLKLAPNGVQKSTGTSLATANVLDIGTRHRPRPLSDISPWLSLDLSGLELWNQTKHTRMQSDQHSDRDDAHNVPCMIRTLQEKGRARSIMQSRLYLQVVRHLMAVLLQVWSTKRLQKQDTNTMCTQLWSVLFWDDSCEEYIACWVDASDVLSLKVGNIMVLAALTLTWSWRNLMYSMVSWSTDAVSVCTRIEKLDLSLYGLYLEERRGKGRTLFTGKWCWYIVPSTRLFVIII